MPKQPYPDMQVGEVYRFANPEGQREYGEWEIVEIIDKRVYAESSVHARFFAVDLNDEVCFNGDWMPILVKPLGPEPYEEWLR